MNQNKSRKPRAGTITRISVQKNNPERVSIELDGDFAFGLPATDLVRLGLKVGLQITDEDAAELTAIDEAARATDAALHFIGYRSRSEQEVRVRLRKRGYAPEAIDIAVQKLRDWKYLDDRAFAEFWVTNRIEHNPRGSRLLTQELYAKGVDREIIKQVLDEYDLGEYDAALKLARQRAASLSRYEPEVQYRRLSGFLARRGYGWDVVGPVLREVLGD